MCVSMSMDLIDYKGESLFLLLHSKHKTLVLLDQRRRWADVVQMLYKCFVFAGLSQRCIFIDILPFK